MRAWLNKKKEGGTDEMTFIKVEPHATVIKQEPSLPLLESASSIKLETPTVKKETPPRMNASSMKLTSSKLKSKSKLNFGLDEEDDESSKKTKKERPRPEDLLAETNVKIKHENSVRIKQEEKDAQASIAYPDVDPLDAYMMSLTHNMTDEEKASVSGKEREPQEMEIELTDKPPKKKRTRKILW